MLSIISLKIKLSPHDIVSRYLSIRYDKKNFYAAALSEPALIKSLQRI